MQVKLLPLEEEKVQKLKKLKEREFFLISDTHFFDPKIEIHEPSRRRYAYDGYHSLEDWFIDRWNQVVGRNDWVLHLGDFAFREADESSIKEILSKLNGKKFLIFGEHDIGKFDFYQKIFDFTVEKAFIYAEINGKFYKIPTGFEKATGLILETPAGRVLFSHYPIKLEEKGFLPHIIALRKVYEQTRCILNIHGHLHSKEIKNPLFVNVSVEKISFRPVKLSGLLKSHPNPLWKK